jgi:hypothetical protein
MAEIDLFGNQIITEEPVKTDKVQNDGLNLFTVNVPEEPIEEESTNELGFQVIQNQGDSGAAVNVSPVYFGKSFEYEGIWSIGKKYFNDEYRTSFVTYKNLLLACNKTHESSLDTEPEIIYDEGVPMGVDNIYWVIALTGSDAGGDTTEIERNLVSLKKIVYNNSDSVTSLNGVVSVMGQNVNDLIKRASSLESDNTQTKKDIKSLQDSLGANIMYPIILTEDEYEALEEKDPNKFYYVYEE